MKLIAYFIWWLITWPILAILVWLPLWLVGVPLVLWSALRKNYQPGEGWQGPCYWWTDRRMSLWETHDNGCCPEWYIRGYGPGRPLWKNVWVWSAFRNAVGGNPLHRSFKTEEVEVYGVERPSLETTRHFHMTGKRKWFWRMIRRGWRVGVWGSLFIGTKDRWRVFDIQHGFKRQYHLYDPETGIVALLYTPWDTGRRSR